MILTTSYFSFAHDSSVQSTIKRWNKLTNPNANNERQPSDIHIIKNYYDSLLSQNTSSIKNVITIPHSDSMTIATLYEQLLHTKISDSVLTSQQRNEVINNTLNIVLQLGLPDTINDRSFISIRKDKVVSFCYFFDIYCNEDNKNPIKLGQISFRYNITKRTFEPAQIWAFGG